MDMRFTATSPHGFVETRDALYDAKEQVMQKVMARLKEPTKGAGLFVDKHQIYGIIAEEVQELLDAIHNNDTENITKELIDVAVAALWGIASMSKEEA